MTLLAAAAFIRNAAFGALSGGTSIRSAKRTVYISAEVRTLVVGADAKTLTPIA